MLIGVIVVPGVVGIVTLALTAKDERTPRRAVEAVARGYPLTVLLAVLLVFLAAARHLAQGRQPGHRWTDAHVPMVVKPGAYEQVADDLDRALTDAGFDVDAGDRARDDVEAREMAGCRGWADVVARSSPTACCSSTGQDLDILIYPMDMLISGKPDAVARARAAMASRLTTSAAHLTVSAEAQAIEDRLTALATGRPATPSSRRGSTTRPRPSSRRSTRRWPRSAIPYEEWEVLYRQRLQVERDLRAGAMAGEAVLGAETPGVGGPTEALATVGRLLRQGASAFIEAATDDETVKALDDLAGTRWKLAAQAADVALVAARAAVRGADEPDTTSEAETAAGEPAPFRTPDKDDDELVEANGTTGRA